MITGFNTDIEYEGVIYHVQTEDKGLETPLILSLVYDRGTILASKRSPYDDLLGNFDEKILADRLQKQHKLICAAIRGGRIEDLKRMTMRESASRKKGLIAQKEVKTKPSEKAAPSIQTEKTSPLAVEKSPVKEKSSSKSAKKEEVPLPQVLHLADERFSEIKKPDTSLSLEAEKLLETELPIPKPAEVWDVPISLSDNDLIIEEGEIQVIEEVMILPSEAVEIITDFSKQDEPKDDTLSVELLKEINFKAGENKTISVLVTRGVEKDIVAGAGVMVKVLGSNFRPLIFHAKTDSNGVAIIQLHLPNFSRGRAAVMIKAISGNEESELRRIIQPG